jgi:molecular chaperone DnaK
MSVRPAFGIDVGATHSVMAWINPAGHSELLCDREGTRFIPSLVHLGDSGFCAGDAARLRGLAAPERIGRLMKLALGKPLHDAALGGERFPPEVLHACLLSKLRAEIIAQVGEPCGVVLTVPGYFGELRRKAVCDAAEMAGLKLLDLLNEPTAAALAFNEHTGYFAPAGAPLRPLKALVYNLNGSTFETTLLEITPGGIETLAVDGDLSLGGDRWDERLADCAAEQFIRRYGLDPRDDDQTRRQLLARAQRAKHALSLRASAHFPLACEGKTLEVCVGREQFQHATFDLLERTTEIVERMLATMGAGWPAVDRVLLTGGATQMPMVREHLRNLAGREPDCSVHPNEAVARGAALYAHKVARFQMPRLHVAEVATRSLGVLGVDSQTGARINQVLIERGARLPAAATERIILQPERTKEVVVAVLEGDSRNPQECEAVAKAILSDLPADLAEEWPVMVTLECTSNGRLRVHARLCYTGREVQLDLADAVGLTPGQRERWRAVVEKDSSFAVFRAEVHRKRNVPVGYAASPGAASADLSNPAESVGIPSCARPWWRPLAPAIRDAEDDLTRRVRKPDFLTQPSPR